MASLKVIERKPDEEYDDYFRRALKTTAEENKAFVIEIFNRYVDITPETTFDYLKGFYEAYLGPLN